MNLKKEKISVKEFIKKINWQLLSNFYTLDTLLSSSKRKDIQAIRLIAKLNYIKISKKEAKEVLSSLKLIKSEKKINIDSINVVQKLFEFASLIKESIREVLVFGILDKLLSFMFNYRSHREKVWRN